MEKKIQLSHEMASRKLVIRRKQAVKSQYKEKKAGTYKKLNIWANLLIRKGFWKRKVCGFDCRGTACKNWCVGSHCWRDRHPDEICHLKTFLGEISRVFLTLWGP